MVVGASGLVSVYTGRHARRKPAGKESTVGRLKTQPAGSPWTLRPVAEGCPGAHSLPVDGGCPPLSRVPILRAS